MKFISFAIPSYNSEKYMRNCIDSILTGGEDVEIIIVNDGSQDGTGAIADEYAEKYPTICKAVHQENGGHGEGVNQGIRNATGLYYKVVDSDDWVSDTALAETLAVIKRHVEENSSPDLYLTNFVYEHVEDNSQFVRTFAKNMPVGRFFGWDEVKRFKGSECFLMHSLMYKTSVLRESGLVLPKHTFYVDNIFAYSPLPYVKTMYYIDVDLYRYYIGRADQSVNIKNFSKRTEQQNRVMKIMAEAHDLREVCKISKPLGRYMLHALACIMMVTLTFSYVYPTKEKNKAIKQLWKDIKAKDKWLYKKLRYRSYPLVYCFILPFLRAPLTRMGYKILTKKVKLG